MIKRKPGKMFIIVQEDCSCLPRMTDIAQSIYYESDTIYEVDIDVPILSLMAFYENNFKHPDFVEIKEV